MFVSSKQLLRPMLSRPSLSTALKYILAKMTVIHNFRLGAWQRQFLGELFQVLLRMRGRVNFINMARYSVFCEQTFRRHFAKAFQWVTLNLTVVWLCRHPREPLIGVFDCTFVPKSGTETWGIDRFFSSAARRTKRGQEVSILGVVATESREAFGIDATQTPAGLSGRGVSEASKGYSSVDFYIEQIEDLQKQMADLGVSYWVGDGFYAKRKVFDAITKASPDREGHLITRLRSDANLRYLYTGPERKAPGPRSATTEKSTGIVPSRSRAASRRSGVCRTGRTSRSGRPWPTAHTLGSTYASCYSGIQRPGVPCFYARPTRSRRPRKW